MRAAVAISSTIINKDNNAQQEANNKQREQSDHLGFSHQTVNSKCTAFDGILVDCNFHFFEQFFAVSILVW